eukprot:GEZU01019832.1.p1 GENE.GEZU01019832.1~~GEZU01019832.1.p1  ORF type:complete len:498 (+),score=195.41 GEZU01019832.1:2102-3595(+)
MSDQQQPTTTEVVAESTAKLVLENSNNNVTDKKPIGEKKEKSKKEEGDKPASNQRKSKQGLIEVEPVKGTRDFYPEDMRVRNWLFAHFKEVSRLFGFQEYDAPILESEELYKRKAGEEITQQMYNFKDKGDRPVSLRPEMTPSLARMILKQGKALLMPIKWFSLPQCWRYEEMRRGRRREHYQWNMDIFGVPSVTAEAELLAAIVTFFERVGLTSKDVGIKINSRKVIQTLLADLGVTGEKFAPTCVIIDKLDKLSREEVESELAKLGLTPTVSDQIIKFMELRTLDDLVAKMGKDHEAVQELSEVFEYAKAGGFADYLQFDASVVRGLAYYTGIVFEAFDRSPDGIQRAICGGGRYDKLLSMFGSKEDIPACGFGFGDCVIIEILKDKHLLPKELEKPQIDDVVIVFDETLRGASYEVCNILRKKGRSVDPVLAKKKKLAWAYSYADRVGASRVILLAPSEWQNKMVRVKNLRAAAATDGNNNAEAKEQDVYISDL